MPLQGPDNTKCAAGILIPDSNYSEYMETWPVESLEYFTKRYNAEEVELIQRLQTIHDKSDLVRWEQDFEDLAKEKGLNYAPANL